MAILQKIKFLLLIIPFFLTGCSWYVLFGVQNNSLENVRIEMYLDSLSGGFPIFEDNEEAFRMKKNGDINWERKVELKDKDSSDWNSVVTIPPGTVYVIGRLSNDTYKSYNQYFINGRVFNLKKLVIIQNSDTLTITPETFDRYFVQDNGMVAFSIRNQKR
jgi:hypothetical protein